MRTEIECYITRNYYELLKICKKFTKNDDWASELLHFVILELYDKKEINVKVDDTSIKSYIIRIIMVNWKYPTSPFNRKIKNVHRNDMDINELLELTSKETNITEHEILEIIETEWTELDVYPKNLFERYLVLGSLKKVSIDTNIPLTTVKRNIDLTRKTIKENTFRKINQ